jgi:hypothetical protein
MSPAANTAAAELRRRSSAERADLESRLAREHHVRQRADACDDRVGLESQPAFGDDRADPASVAVTLAFETLDLVLADDLDPVLLENPLEVAPGGLAEGALKRHRLLHHDRAALAQLGQRRGDLAANVGAADHHDPLAALDIGSDRLGVGQRAQVVDALEVAAVNRQAAHHCAGGDEGAAEFDRLTVRERGRPRVGIERHHAGAGEQLDRVVMPPLLRLDHGIVARLATLKQAL